MVLCDKMDRGLCDRSSVPFGGRPRLHSPLIDLVCVVTVDIALLHQREGDTVIYFTKGGNLLVSTWLLPTKLIRGKTKDHDATVGIFLVECLETFVLWGKSTEE